MLPQVLAGLGSVSLLSAGCLLWLQRLQPVFFTVAVFALAYEVWLISRRRDVLRIWTIKMVLAASVTFNVALIGGWILITVRYR